MLQKYLMMVLLLMVFFTGYSQDKMEDVVYLKNGSIIRGTIIEQVPNQSIKLKTNDRNVFVFKFEEIEKIAKEVAQDMDYLDNFKKNGFINITEICINPGISNVKMHRLISVENNTNGFGIKTVNGYQFSKHFSTGFGIGV